MIEQEKSSFLVFELNSAEHSEAVTVVRNYTRKHNFLQFPLSSKQ